MSLRLDELVVGVYRLREIAENEAWTYVSRVGRSAYQTLVVRGVNGQVVNSKDRTEVPRDSFFDGVSSVNSMLTTS